MRREIAELLKDIREAAERATRHTAGLDREQFGHDEKTVDAVVRCLAILGEAAKQVPIADRSQYPDLPWREMTGLRDRVVHDYLGIDLDIVWDVVQHRIPELLAKLPPDTG